MREREREKKNVIKILFGYKYSKDMEEIIYLIFFLENFC